MLHRKHPEFWTGHTMPCKTATTSRTTRKTTATRARARSRAGPAGASDTRATSARVRGPTTARTRASTATSCSRGCDDLRQGRRRTSTRRSSTRSRRRAKMYIWGGTTLRANTRRFEYDDLINGSDIAGRTRRGRSRTSATRGRTYVCSAESRGRPLECSLGCDAFCFR